MTPVRAKVVAVGSAVALVLVSSVAIGAVEAPVRHLSPSGSDSGDCIDRPCRTMDYAYRQAQPGDTIELAAGDYGTQDVFRDPAKDEAAQRVVFRAAEGARVTTSQLGLGGQQYDGVGPRHVEIQGLTVTGWLDLRRTVDVVIRDVRVGGTSCAGCKDTRYVGGEWGVGSPSTGTHPEFSVFNRPGVSVPVEGLTVDGVHIHHIGRPAGREDVHTNCLHVWGSGHRDIVVRNSRFDHCDVFSSLINGNIDGVTFENNVFAPSTNTGLSGRAFYSIMLTGGVSNAVIRNNTFADPPVINQGGIAGNNRVVGNLGANSRTCMQNVSYSHNVWTEGATCSSTDRRVSDPGWDSTYHLTSSSPAINAADPNDHPATDMEGQARPAGGGPDAGADEFGGQDPEPTPTPTPTPTPGPYDPRCRPNCDEQIEQLTGERDRARAELRRVREALEALVVSIDTNP